MSESNPYTWTSAQIEEKRREIADQLGDVRVDLRYLADCHQELHDRYRTGWLRKAYDHATLAEVALANARRNVEQVAS